MNSTNIEYIGWTLIHSTWLLLVIGQLFVLVDALTRRASAKWRYRLSLITMLLMASVPLAAMAYVVSTTQVGLAVTDSQFEPVNVVVPETSASSKLIAQTATGTDLIPAAVAESVSIELQETGAHQTVAQHQSQSAGWFQQVRTSLKSRLPEIVYAWLCGLALFGLRPVIGLRQMSRLRRTGRSQLPAWVEDLGVATAERFQMRVVEMSASTLVQVPTVVGFLRPVILLPGSMITGLNAEQLRAVIAHELAHVKRMDTFVRVFQVALETVFFYHPMVWWVSRRMNEEREHCCDDLAIQVTEDRLSYSRMLLTVEELRGTTPSMAVAASGGSLLGRIQRIVGTKPEDAPTPKLLVTLLALLIVAVAAPLIDTRATFAKEKEQVHGEKSPQLQILKQLRKHGVSYNTNHDFPGQLVKSLTVGHDPTDSDATWLLIAKLTSVESLMVWGTELTAEKARHIEKLSELRSLRIFNCQGVTPQILSSIGKLRNLEELEVTFNVFNSKPDENLKKLGALTDAEVERLDELSGPDGKNLSIAVAAIWTDRMLPQLNSLKKLRKLKLNNTFISDVGLGHFTPLQRLDTLRFSGKTFPEEVLQKFVKSHPQLRELSRWNANDADLEILAELKHLEELDVWAGDVTDEGAASQAKLTKLKRLEINGHQMSDAGLEHLTALSNLETLKMRNMAGPATEDGIAELQKVLPDCEIRYSFSEPAKFQPALSYNHSGKTTALTDGQTVTVFKGYPDNLLYGGYPMTSVTGFDLSVIDVKPHSPTILRVEALKCGKTSLNVNFDGHKPIELNIIVEPDLRGVRRGVELIAGDAVTVTYSLDTDKVTLQGAIDDQNVLARLTQFLKEFDEYDLKFDNQVKYLEPLPDWAQFEEIPNWFTPDPYPEAGYSGTKGDAWNWFRLVKFARVELGLSQQQADQFALLYDLAPDRFKGVTHLLKGKPFAISVLDEWRRHDVDSRMKVSIRQLERLDQLLLQKKGRDFFIGEEAPHAMALTPKQHQDLKDAVERYKERIREFAPDETVHVRQAAYRRLWFDFHEILTPQQRERYRQLRGPLEKQDLSQPPKPKTDVPGKTPELTLLVGLLQGRVLAIVDGDPPATLDEFDFDSVESKESTVVVVHAEKDVPAADIQRLIERLKEAGFERFAFKAIGDDEALSESSDLPRRANITIGSYDDEVFVVVNDQSAVRLSEFGAKHMQGVMETGVVIRVARNLASKDLRAFTNKLESLGFSKYMLKAVEIPETFWEEHEPQPDATEADSKEMLIVLGRPRESNGNVLANEIFAMVGDQEPVMLEQFFQKDLKVSSDRPVVIQAEEKIPLADIQQLIEVLQQREVSKIHISLWREPYVLTTPLPPSRPAVLIVVGDLNEMSSDQLQLTIGNRVVPFSDYFEILKDSVKSQDDVVIRIHPNVPFDAIQKLIEITSQYKIKGVSLTGTYTLGSVTQPIPVKVGYLRIGNREIKTAPYVFCYQKSAKVDDSKQFFENLFQQRVAKIGRKFAQQIPIVLQGDENVSRPLLELVKAHATEAGFKEFRLETSEKK